MEILENHVRWWYSSHGTAHLELLATPSAKFSPLSWTKLTRDESNRCEGAWQALKDEEKIQSQKARSDRNVATPTIEDGEEDQLLGVPIGKERLFEVDVRTMMMYPVFWKLSGPPIVVRRVLWMYDNDHPVDEPLAQQLEDAYQTIKPWKPSYHDELLVALQVGPAAYEKLRSPLPDGSVFFDDANSARLIYNSVANRVSAAFFSSLRGAKSSSPYPSSPLVYRGYDEAVRRANIPSGRASASPSRQSSIPLDSLDLEKKLQRKSLEVKTTANIPNERDRLGVDLSGVGSIDVNIEDEDTPADETKVGEGHSEDVSDLIFVVHGIGQALSTQYEHYNFIYMVNLMRIVARKQATSLALNSIMRSHNVQFLPIQWRTSFKLDGNESRKRTEEGLDNSFSLADITLKQHIPMIRELANEVLIDIPYFMSHHQAKMIESLCYQANRAYRLWCARNPSFAKHGKVHIIAHSLGAPLCAAILSSQPTIQPPLEDLHAKIPWNQFPFNVSSLFMLGSAFAVFLHINQAQLIARKGRERTMESSADEALDRAGQPGCMAIDSLYNVFQLSDPIAYKLNPCVDSVRAAELPPIAIPSITGTLLGSFQKGMSKMLGGLINPFATASTNGPADAGGSEEAPFELGGGTGRLQGSRGERRFAALNPHGTLDFYLPGEGNISEYVDMITAHSSYWGDSSLAAFILAEICARKDLARTGLGPASSQGAGHDP